MLCRLSAGCKSTKKDMTSHRSSGSQKSAVSNIRSNLVANDGVDDGTCLKTVTTIFCRKWSSSQRLVNLNMLLGSPDAINDAVELFIRNFHIAAESSTCGQVSSPSISLGSFKTRGYGLSKVETIPTSQIYEISKSSRQRRISSC